MCIILTLLEEARNHQRCVQLSSCFNIVKSYMYIYVYAVYLCTLCEILVLLVYMLFIYVYGVRFGIVMSYMLFFNVYRV